MRSFPSPGDEGALAAIARERMLLVLSLEGALAPGATDGGAPGMGAVTHGLLRAAALLYPCAVIAGVRRAEVAARVGAVPLVATLGCHGAEPGFGPLDAATVRAALAWPARRAGTARRDAVERLCSRLHVPAAYVGGGPADEEAFRSPAVHVALRVGPPAGDAVTPAHEAPQLDDVLRALIAARVEADGRGATWQGVVRAVGGA